MELMITRIKEGYYTLHGDREYSLEYLGYILWCPYDGQWQFFPTDTYLDKGEISIIHEHLQGLEDLPKVNDSSN